MKGLVPVYLATLAAFPWMILRISGYHGGPAEEAAWAGLSVLGAAFLLAWAAETAQLDISASLAVAILSFIAVLPEYAVDIYFAWQAGKDPVYTQYAVANMTGANRLLIGIGWSTIALLSWWKTKQKFVSMDKKNGLELGALTLATLYALWIPFKGDLSLLDTVILIGLFILYIRATARQTVEEPHLVGPALTLSTLPTKTRRIATLAMFAFAAAAILYAAEPFAEGLVESGKLLGIDEFLLVQWLAPLASEAPEFIIALLFVLQGRAELGLRAMISSKVNQWTLLVGMLPLAYSLSSGALTPMPLDARQVEEVFLTVAQSAFAVVLLAHFRFSVGAALVLLALFLGQFFLPQWNETFRMAYLALAGIILLLDIRRIRQIGSAMGMLITCSTPKKG